MATKSKEDKAFEKDLTLRRLTPKDALSLLKTFKDGRKNRVHSMDVWGGGQILMGCDVDLAPIKKKLVLAGNEIYISDTVVGHSVVFKDVDKYLFLETDQVKVATLKKLRKIK